jgi:hypothetical protein
LKALTRFSGDKGRAIFVFAIYLSKSGETNEDTADWISAGAFANGISLIAGPG